MAASPRKEQTVIPVIDGQVIDRFQLSFTGNVELDPTDEDDLALINEVKLGRTLVVSVRVNADTAGGGKVNRDRAGFVKSVTGKAAATATSVEEWHVVQDAERPRAEPKTLDEAIPPAPAEAAPKSRRVRGSRASRGETPSRSQQATAGAHLTPVDDPTDPPV